MVYGDNTQAQTDDAIKRFRSGDASVLIGNPASMSHISTHILHKK